MLDIPHEVTERMKQIDRQLLDEALGYKGKWKHRLSPSLDREAARKHAIEKRREEFDQEQAAKNPKIKALAENTVQLIELHRRQEIMLKDLLHAAALKAAAEAEINQGKEA